MVKGIDYVTAGQKANTTLGNGATAEGQNTTASGPYSHAEGQNTTASGPLAHAEGQSTVAKEVNAHTEGNGTTASNANTHAEGLSTIASGPNAHAEGSGTVAREANTHAEGNSTTASNANAHAEGYLTIASNANAHAEGNGTTAAHTNAHAEGFKTVTGNANQHVGGRWNIGRNNTLFEIGNGTANNARSNAFEVYEDGNIFVAGNVANNRKETFVTNRGILNSSFVISDDFKNNSIYSYFSNSTENINIYINGAKYFGIKTSNNVYLYTGQVSTGYNGIYVRVFNESTGLLIHQGYYNDASLTTTLELTGNINYTFYFYDMNNAPWDEHIIYKEYWFGSGSQAAGPAVECSTLDSHTSLYYGVVDVGIPNYRLVSANLTSSWTPTPDKITPTLLLRDWDKIRIFVGASPETLTMGLRCLYLKRGSET